MIRGKKTRKNERGIILTFSEEIIKKLSRNRIDIEKFLSCIPLF